MRGDVTDAGQTTNGQTVKIELLSQWKLEAEFRNLSFWTILVVDGTEQLESAALKNLLD